MCKQPEEATPETKKEETKTPETPDLKKEELIKKREFELANKRFELAKEQIKNVMDLFSQLRPPNYENNKQCEENIYYPLGDPINLKDIEFVLI